MPTLEFAHKHLVERHHEKVPFRLLKKHPEKGKPAPSGVAGGMVIHGDNLEALQALMPYYYGRVKLVFIDPPYNTGNEGWVYSDRVNSPAMRRWLKETVGRDDGNRHDKWLCMMWPRLKLLHKLLAKDGSLWMTLDDNEAHYAKLMLDEIFGRENFVANVVWQKRTSPDIRATIGAGHDHILVFSKNIDIFRSVVNKIPKSADQKAQYKNPDNDPKGPWVSSDYTAQGYRPNQMYKITTPGGVEYYPPEGTCWKNIEPVFLQLANEGRIWFGRNGKGMPRRKTYLNESEGQAAWTWWPNIEVGHTQESKKEIHALFGKADAFDTPKPERLLQRILQIATDKDSIVLDSFAGSGTTGHAVLKQNAADGGQRRFVLVEMEEYADTLTAERLRRAIEGYGEDDNRVAGLPGGFDYYTLDKPLFSAVGDSIESSVSFAELGGFVYFLETGQPGFSCPASGPLIGDYNDTRYFMLYTAQGKPTVLDEAALAKLVKKGADRQLVIYADKLAVDDARLILSKAQFRKIPRDIKEQVLRFRELG